MKPQEARRFLRFFVSHDAKMHPAIKYMQPPTYLRQIYLNGAVLFIMMVAVFSPAGQTETFMTNISALLILTIFPAAMIGAAVCDLFTMSISNKISLGLISGFLVLAVLTGMDLKTIGMHLLAGLAMLVISFTLYAKGWIGGGDAKLFAATAIWMGWPNLLEYTLITSMLGGGLTLAMLALRDVPMPLILVKQYWFSRLHTLENGIPYGLALAAGGIYIYPHTDMFLLIAP